ncbi:hypothetical protein [Photobacterium nomapromontoriensis]|uniref:hypothetical protein n=1 Tax=Photobacterium nomapromontoriensis TaxID=2910237 RepID=UPI003D0A1079
MKIHLTVQQFTVLLFGLSLAALTAYLSQLFTTAYNNTDSHLFTSDILDSRRQNGLFDRDTHSPLLHSNDAIVRNMDGPSFDSQPLLVTLTQSILCAEYIHPYNRRALVQNWRLIAMIATVLPAEFYHHSISNHRLGGWKETNIQFRSISQHA